MYFNKFDIKNTNSLRQNITTLENNVCTNSLPWFSFKFDYENKPYYGKLINDTFEIVPVIKGRNSFVPVIIGKINDGNPSIINVKMRMHYAVILILLFILTTSFFAFISKDINIGIIVLLLFTTWTSMEYVEQYKKCKKDLEKIFN
jgi:hypothetical protein